ncbi:MAG: GIY-YIG nuclease family protein [Candidatus Thorarchaeota archaeon]|jgi:Uri superfamily endonuclease
MKGAYMLIIRVKQPISVRIKSLGEISFESGLWVYVGSAMGSGSTSLENRLSRHFRKEKTIYWHIDYLLNLDTEIVEAIWAESIDPIECDLAQAIAARDDFIPGPGAFGSSDCRRRCVAHTYHYQGDSQIQNKLIQVFRDLGLDPHRTKNNVWGQSS